MSKKRTRRTREEHRQILAQAQTPITTEGLLVRLLEKGHETTLAALYYFPYMGKNATEYYAAGKYSWTNKKAWTLAEGYKQLPAQT